MRAFQHIDRFEGDSRRSLAADVRSEVGRLALKEETTRLEAPLESLEPIHREVILLRKYEELTFPEIAARLGRSPDACRMLLARAMTRSRRGFAGRRSAARLLICCACSPPPHSAR